MKIMLQKRVLSALGTAVLVAAFVLILAGCATTKRPNTQVNDAWITSKIESKLAADPEVNNFEIDVDTDNGIVRLSGMVETEGDREEAEKLARDTRGVKGVDNEIELGDLTVRENVTDAWIVTKVKSKLTADPEINPFNIDVDVQNGVVTLTGTVAKEAARDEAGRLAENTRGVKEVRNRIEVLDG